MVSNGQERSAQSEPGKAEAPAGAVLDLGPAIQEQVRQAMQPVLAQFQQQVAQAVREQTDQALRPDGGQRQQEAQPAAEPSREEGQPSRQQPVQQEGEQPP